MLLKLTKYIWSPAGVPKLLHVHDSYLNRALLTNAMYFMMTIVTNEWTRNGKEKWIAKVWMKVA